MIKTAAGYQWRVASKKKRSSKTLYSDGRNTPSYNKYQQSRIKQREHALRKYGITVDQHRQMFISQNGRCAICDKKFIDRRDVCVDHSHTTNQVRQLLCCGCNTRLSAVEDKDFLTKAVEYLNKWNV